MGQEIFREKSIQQINSPEKLDQYLKVTSPSVWLLLLGIIFVLSGFLVWSFFGELTTEAKLGCAVKDKTAACYIKEQDLSSVNKDMKIIINDKEYDIDNINTRGVQISSQDEYIRSIIDIKDNEYSFIITSRCDLEDGVYRGKIILETISPLQFIFN